MARLYSIKFGFAILAGTSALYFLYHFNTICACVYFVANWVQIGKPNVKIPSMGNQSLNEKLNSILNCNNRDYNTQIEERGKYWVLKNYVSAGHGSIKCCESVTFTTHADFTFLDNIPSLVERWTAPVSVAIYAPGSDFEQSIQSIQYLRHCTEQSHLVQQFVTFHIYFDKNHIPKRIRRYQKILNNTSEICLKKAPYYAISSDTTYRKAKNLLYPINVGRNIARDAALTHFILPADIELYPSRGLVKEFLKMVATNPINYKQGKPRVFPIAVFEVDRFLSVPNTKDELLTLIKLGKAVPFHKDICSPCHTIPNYEKWLQINRMQSVNVFHIAKRQGKYSMWEPIFIGTQNDPHYEERLSWEGKYDKMTQEYVMCALDYEFGILDNAFLVHKPGIKKRKKNFIRDLLVIKTNDFNYNVIYPELKALYGVRKECGI